MNRLLIGNADKTEQLLKTSGAFLLIDDGEICDAFLETFPTARDFDPHKHHFNPLEGMDYKKARDFADLVYGVSPQGANTLTVRNGKRALVKLLLEQPTGLDALPTPKTPAEEEAVGMIQDLLVSPISKVFCAAIPTSSFPPTESLSPALTAPSWVTLTHSCSAIFLSDSFKDRSFCPMVAFIFVSSTRP